MRQFAAPQSGNTLLNKYSQKKQTGRFLQPCHTQNPRKARYTLVLSEPPLLLLAKFIMNRRKRPGRKRKISLINVCDKIVEMLR